MSMRPLDPSCIRAYLRSTALEDWVAWCDRVADAGVAAAIKAVLVDRDSGSTRDPRIIRAALLDLASREPRFREFLESEASPDAITAGFLEEKLDET
jgi:hypothetical protein